MISYSLLNDGNALHSPDFVHAIALIRGADKYGTMRDGLSRLFGELEQLSKHEEMPIPKLKAYKKFVLYLTGDWKWLER